MVGEQMVGIRSSARSRSRSALGFGIFVLLVAAATGCGGGSHPTPLPPSSASASQVDTTPGAPSTTAPTGLLYSGKTATFSATYAVEHDCPTILFIDLTDSGPRLRNPKTDGNGHDSHGNAWPDLQWSPPCSGMTPQVDFDGVTAAAKVSGSQTESSCRTAAERSLRDGTSLRAYSPSALVADDEFCEYVRPSGRVILLQVASVSANVSTQIAWSITEWAEVPPTQNTPEPGGVRYADQTFVVGEKRSGASRGGCDAASINLGDMSGPIVFYGQTSGDMVWFPPCLGAGKIRFGDYAAQVNGAVGAAECENAAASSGRNSLDVDLSALQVGSEYCEYSNQAKMVFLVKVVSVAASSPASVEFSATSWTAPATS